MKFLGITTLLLPATALAQGVVFTRQIIATGDGCNSATIRPVFSADNRSVEVTLDRFFAQLPIPRETFCSLDFRVTHPVGRSTVNAVATLIGDVSLPEAGVSAFVQRNYVISPTTVGRPTGETDPPALEFVGPTAVGFNEVDRFTYSQSFTATQDRTVSIKLNDARLRLQQSTGDEGFIRQSVFILDIHDQSSS
ncbi:hypothetical protein QC762_402185 [Podospora pseudocomata]|uniref:Ubiquitin 3 binding protein But2 C-terminal domain-containing protein n=4 Tax=Podospora TaxID=5144 RepID=A0ABR0HC80_9PEZI|nr:hypothetical protein QC761_0063140 [Podospora bellae-mahoneyi]KAK4654225.1 hypothetical protein QC762_402185 [Podospora pseudocomata]KAK4665486.1 hypothetical protein QC763_0062960 [Podospora pseudopauciseta]KAK4676637.1 hypothetical protein QC764_0062480 [Podospora pseudoanserina]